MTGGDLLAQLAAVRYRRKLSQAVVAERMGVSPARVGHIESGYRTPNLGTLLRYADAIGAELVVVAASCSHTVAASADNDEA